MLGSRRFLPLFIVQFFGAANDNVLKNAMLVLLTFGVIKSENPAILVNLSAGIFILPFFLFSAWAGIIAEKNEKSFLTRKLKLLELLLAIVGSVGIYTQNIWLLLTVLFGLGVQAALFGPIKYAIIPQHMKPEELVKANAYIEGGTFLAILLGTIIGGLLILALREYGTVLTCFVLISFALIGYFASRFIPLAPSTNPSLVFEKNLIKATMQVLKEGASKRVLLLSMLGISWFWFLGAVILTQLPLFVKEYLHGNESMITMFLAIFSVGIGIGSISCEKLSHKQVEIGLVPIGSIGITLFLADLAFADPSPVRSAIDFFFISFFSGFFTVPLYSLLQQRSDEGKRSRTIAANNILNAAFMVVASLVAIALFKLGAVLTDIFLMLLTLHIFVAAYVYTQSTEFLWRFMFWVSTFNFEKQAPISNVIVVPFGIKNYMRAAKSFRHDIYYVVASKNLNAFWRFVFTRMGAHIYDDKPNIKVLENRNYISDVELNHAKTL